MKALQLIEGYGLSTTSYIQAVHDVNIAGDLGERVYRERIGELGNYSNQDDILLEMLPFVYGYMIQEAVRNPDLNGGDLFQYGCECAYNFVNSHQFIFAKPEEEVKLDADGQVKPKKGAKKEQAEALALEYKDKGLTRQEWIALLVEQVGLTKPGASSYYARLKKEHNL